MLSPLQVNEQPLELHRYPVNQQNRSLQAWDAADEYIVNYLNDQNLLESKRNILIFNDSFGALTTALNPHKITCVSDSKVAHLGLQYNLNINQLDTDNLTQLNSLDVLPSNPDIVLLKIPKSKALLISQLIELESVCTNETVIVAGARAKDIHKSTLDLFERYLGVTTTSLAVKKARLVFCQRNPNITHQAPQPNQWPLEGSNFVITNHANVFSRESLDIGARFFMAHLPKLKSDQSVIDLGCGNGVIGLSLLAQNPSAQITFVDESHMAVASAKQNIETNTPALAKQCQFIWQDCLTDTKAASADLVLCNPPFHQQHAVTDHIAWQMFKESHKALKPGGELRIVGNRQLGYHIKLKRLFGNCQTIASNKKFVILSAQK